MSKREIPYFVLLGLCTYHRQTSLKLAIKSILALKIPKDVELELMVVDNSKEACSRSMVNELSKNSKFMISYCHESKHGISFARNRVLDFALVKGYFNAIAFFDDDAVLDPRWLNEMYKYVKSQGLEAGFVLTGPQKFVLPQMLLFGRKKPNFFQAMSFASGTLRPWAATHNVFFAISLIRDMGLVFDPDFALTGGEDQMFFMQAVQKGARIIWLEEAIAEEKVIKARLSFDWLLKRNFRYSSQGFRMYNKLFSWSRALALSLIKSGLYLSSGLILLFPLGILAALLPFSRHYTLRALAYISRSLGWLLGCINFRYREYGYEVASKKLE